MKIAEFVELFIEPVHGVHLTPPEWAAYTEEISILYKAFCYFIENTRDRCSCGATIKTYISKSGSNEYARHTCGRCHLVYRRSAGGVYYPARAFRNIKKKDQDAT
jgi:hypothetical protein